MSWRDNLRPASFRGIPFEVIDNGNTSGRRVQVHEFPNREKPYVEDLGKKAESFSIVAFVIGDDYIEKRDRLKAACLTPGSGTLIHPTYGTLEVVCENMQIDEKLSEGRMASFTLSFVEEGEEIYPEETTDLKEAVFIASDALDTSAISNFSKKFKIDEVGAITNEVAATAGAYAQNASSVISAVNTEIGKVAGVVATGMQAIDEVTEVADMALDMKNNAFSILNTPDVFAARLMSMISTVQSFSGSNSFRNVKSIITGNTYADEGTDINPTSSAPISNSVAAQNIEAINHLTQQLVLSAEAKSLASLEFDNAEDANQVLEEFLEDVDTQLLSESEIMADDAIIENIQDIRSAVQINIQERIEKLPELKSVKFSETVPSLLVAYHLYKDLDRAPEIAKRNRIKNPAFIPPDTELKVLAK